jgi:cation transport ATPase
MKTSTIEVGELVSSLSAAGVSRQLSALPGVHHADVNYVAGSATVHYDESRITLEAIRQRVIDCGYHWRGELVPAHVCDAAEHKTTGNAHAGQGDHGLHAESGKSRAHEMSDMMHDMGHAPGMSMQDMTREMRNRFLVALLFAIPVPVLANGRDVRRLPDALWPGLQALPVYRRHRRHCLPGLAVSGRYVACGAQQGRQHGDVDIQRRKSCL